MFPVLLDYASPSAFESNRSQQMLGLAANARRPVRFHARIAREVYPFRLALQALGELVWSNDSWMTNDDFLSIVLDPVITVHPDRVFFEAFSQDQSAYGLLIADRSLFETDGEVLTGTTNVDFTGWLWAALGELRSSRETWLRVEPAGFEVSTVGAGGRFQEKVDLPDEWVRGFLQLQGAMALPGTRLRCRPVDLLSAIRFLRQTKARVAPRALRYEFPPNADARLILEPFEHCVPLNGASHNYQEFKVTRVWGRRRLRLLEPLLPFADEVEIYLKGRALPSFYAVHLPGLTFLLGLSGWSAQRWTGSGSFDLLTRDAQVDEKLLQRALTRLREQYEASETTLSESLAIAPSLASQLLAQLCRRGQAIFDVQKRNYRLRELFENPIDEQQLYPPDPRREAASSLLAAGNVEITQCEMREKRKLARLRTPDGKVSREIVLRDWVIAGRVTPLRAPALRGPAVDNPSAAVSKRIAVSQSRTVPQSGAILHSDAVADRDVLAAEIVVNDNGRIIFGRCDCPDFAENLMNQGPCEHLLAVFEASAPLRNEGPSSATSSGPADVGAVLDSASHSEES